MLRDARRSRKNGEDVPIENPAQGAYFVTFGRSAAPAM